MTQPSPPSVFAPELRKLRLARAARNFPAHDFLHRKVAEDALDRLETVQKRFERALFHGPGAPLLAEILTEKADVGEVTIAGESAAFLKALGTDAPVEARANALPFADKSFDLVVSLMSLHAEDDLPGALVEMRRVLEPDGLFIASFPAERTLSNLRQALRDAEAAVTGGVSPRVAPFVATKDAGGLLQRAGFALPVVDVQPVTVRYRNPMTLLQDLRGMGETLALAKGSRALRRDVLGQALATLDGQETVFEIGVLTGWAPHPSQPKPLKPGSAKASLADAVRGMKGD
ncbi:class I SAM-dependent methyltransferase [Parvularcula lutaonensis]|uniref:Class I SAM-dependent methyltransferase n=1 Tax=Parvularcula lutaonensis TaxID=491923 RepID=A0ABV7MD31_9PROT|nr:class I SAM-dependent methyltransferase [Parvularcula lutaonensis]GGY39637.1 SAM-dependent methyltransferase [Parvularcula lutaonensis]